MKLIEPHPNMAQLILDWEDKKIATLRVEPSEVGREVANQAWRLAKTPEMAALRASPWLGLSFGEGIRVGSGMLHSSFARAFEFDGMEVLSFSMALGTRWEIVCPRPIALPPHDLASLEERMPKVAKKWRDFCQQMSAQMKKPPQEAKAEREAALLARLCDAARPGEKPRL